MNKELREQLIRVATNNPELAEVVKPFIDGEIEIETIEDIQPERYLQAMFGGEAGDKVAFNEDTKRFVAWCVQRGKEQGGYSEGKTKATVEKLSGKAPLPAPEKGKSGKKSGDLKVGEAINFDKYKNANETNQDICDEFNYADREQYGIVTKIERDGVLVQMHDKRKRKIGSPILVEGFKTGKTTGMYRHSMTARIGTSERRGVILEVVYLRGGKKPPSMSQQQAFAEYVNNGVVKGESREAIYYTGMLTRFAYNIKDNQLYFSIKSDQRKWPTNINPSQGDLLYVGKMGQRPSGWESDLKDEVKVLLSKDPVDPDDEKSNA